MSDFLDMQGAKDLNTDAIHLSAVANSKDPVTGAPIGTHVNRVGGTDYTLQGFWNALGPVVMPWTFATGGTLNYPNEAALNPVDGNYYGWTGAFPKVVAAGATPATSGGIGAGAWVDRTDVTLRNEILDRVKTASVLDFGEAAASDFSTANSVIIISQSWAEFVHVDDATYSITPERARFADAVGNLFCIKNRTSVKTDWFKLPSDTGDEQAWKTAFDLKARHIHLSGNDIHLNAATHTDAYGNKYFIAAKADFKLHGHGSNVYISDLGDVNFNLITTRFSDQTINFYEVNEVVIRGPSRLAGTTSTVRGCYDAYNVLNTSIKDCTWYGGDFSTLVGVDSNNPKASCTILRPKVFNVLTIQIDPADTSFFYGHCANGTISDAVVYQDGVDLAQFCEVHESNWVVSRNRVFGVRVFAFVDHGGYTSLYSQETKRSIFSHNIVSCMNSFVTPTDATSPFASGHVVGNIEIVNNIVVFIPTITGRNELPNGIFSPSDRNGNGVESVENINIESNQISFNGFTQTTNIRPLSIQSKYARNISIKDNNIIGINAIVVRPEVLSNFEFINNSVTLTHGDYDTTDCYSIDLRCASINDLYISRNKWSITNPKTNKEVMLLGFTNASNLIFENEIVQYGSVSSYFYQLVTDTSLLNAGLKLVDIPLKTVSIQFDSITAGNIGMAHIGIFSASIPEHVEVGVTIKNIKSGAYPNNARIMGNFQYSQSASSFTSAVAAVGGGVSGTVISAMVGVTIDTRNQ